MGCPGGWRGQKGLAPISASDLPGVSGLSHSRADIALIGLAVMGQNLVLNMNDHGFVVSEETLPRKAVWQHWGLELSILWALV